MRGSDYPDLANATYIRKFYVENSFLSCVLVPFLVNNFDVIAVSRPQFSTKQKLRRKKFLQIANQEVTKQKIANQKAPVLQINLKRIIFQYELTNHKR
jgi:hypothetical protein